MPARTLPSGSVFKKAAPALSKALKPKTELEENNLKVRLANAGFQSPNAATFYLAIKTCFLIMGLLFGGGYGVFKFGLDYNTLCSLVIAGGVGFYFPELVLTIVRSRRHVQDLPLASRCPRPAGRLC